MKKFGCLFLIIFLSFSFIPSSVRVPQFYCTAADSRYFNLLLNLLGSIHNSNFEDLQEIAVFNLGFTSQQINILKKIKKVNVYELEQVNPFLLKNLKTSPQGRMVKGFFSWKPVVLKQSLDMFPYVLYLDAGITVLKSCRDLFNYLVKKNHFLVAGEAEVIKKRITQKPFNYLVKNSKKADFLLSDRAFTIAAGIQGLSRAMLPFYVLPMYEHSKDIDLFADDGSGSLGFGSGRHDQLLFSIYVNRLGLKTFKWGRINLDVNYDNYNINIHYDFNKLNKNTIILVSQAGAKINGGFKKFIKWL